jgi:glycosyltransferase involved in cell wall biosynthesis
MIEAMACGTPVLAFRRGSVHEVVDDALTGRIIENVEDAILTLPRVLSLNRRAVRRRFEERFTSTRMAKNYLRVYKALLAQADAKRISDPTESIYRGAAEDRAIEPNEPVI